MYGFPNDSSGSALNIAAEEESLQNDETDSQGSGFSDENNSGNDVIEVAFVDEEDSEIHVERYNVIMQATGVAAAPGLQAQQWRRTARQRHAN